MSIYTHLENHDAFYIILSFFIVIIVLGVLTFCIIMTEIIVYDAGKSDRPMDVIAAQKRTPTLTFNHKTRHYIKSGLRKLYLLSKIHKNSQKELTLKNKKDKNQLKIQTGPTAGHLIDLLFEAVSMELKDRSDQTNKLCIPIYDSAGDKIVSEKTLRDLSFRQNTLAMLIKVVSSFDPEMLERLISPDLFPAVTYQDILNQLKRLQDRVIEEQKIAWEKLTQQDRTNRKHSRKMGETESIVAETLIKNIEMTKETMARTDSEDSRTPLTVEKANCPSVTIMSNAKLIGGEQLKEEPALSPELLSNVEPFETKQIAEDAISVEDCAGKSVSTVEDLKVGTVDLK